MCFELRRIAMMHDEAIMNRQSECIDAGEVQHDGFSDTAVIKLEMVAIPLKKSCSMVTCPP